MAWLQRLDAAVRERDIDVVLPVDPLSLSVHFWRRLSGLAPLLEQPLTERLDAVDSGDRPVVEVAESDSRGNRSCRRTCPDALGESTTGWIQQNTPRKAYAAMEADGV